MNHKVLLRVFNIWGFLFLVSSNGCTQTDSALKGNFSDWSEENEGTFNIQGDLDSIDISIESILYFELGSIEKGYSNMPNKLDVLVNLAELNCVHNYFEKLPCGLQIYSSLRSVNFSWNPIKNISSCILEYKSLFELKLNHTEIDSIPEEICQLEHLEIISLGNSGVRYIPDCMANMPNLKVLDLKCDWLPEDEDIELLESDREILRFTKDERKRLREMMPQVRIIFGDKYD